jgi:type II secretory pathway pseudopilin PulG
MKIIHGKAGFTLIETLVSFTILTLVLATLLSGIITALRTEIRTNEAIIALTFSQSQLAGLGVVNLLREGRTTGVLKNGLSWTLNISPYIYAASRQNVPKAYWIDLDIRTSAAQNATSILRVTEIKLDDSSLR